MKKTLNVVSGWLWMYAVRAGFALFGLARSLEKDAYEKLAKEVKALYVEKDGKYVLDVDGDDDTSGLKSALGKERERAKNEEKLRKELEKRFEGIDPDVVREMMARFENDEDAKLIKNGQIDKVVEKRVEQMKKGFEKQLADAKKETEAAQARSKKFSNRVLDNHIRAAAAAMGLHKHAIEDALFRARSMFTLNDDGDAVMLDGEQPKLGKDGKTPFSPAEWLEGMKESAPHWFPAGNNGSGAQGDRGATGGRRQIRRADYEKLSPEERQTTAKDKNIAIVD